MGSISVVRGAVTMNRHLIIALISLVSLTGCVDLIPVLLWDSPPNLDTSTPDMTVAGVDQPGIGGIVIDCDSQVPVIYANVSLLERNSGKVKRIGSTVTDKQGKFFFKPIRPWLLKQTAGGERYDISIDAQNYQSVTKDITASVMALHMDGPNVDLGTISLTHEK